MKLAIMILATAVTAGFLASDALAQHGRHGSARHYRAAVSHHGYHGHGAHTAYRSVHGYHGYPNRHGVYYRPSYGHLPYGHPPVIVRPPACGYAPVPYYGTYNAYRYRHDSVNSFYYRQGNIGIGIRF